MWFLIFEGLILTCNKSRYPSLLDVSIDIKVVLGGIKTQQFLIINYFMLSLERKVFETHDKTSYIKILKARDEVAHT